MSISNPILTFSENGHLLGALDYIEDVDTLVVLGDGESSIFGMVEPDSVLVWESSSLFMANDNGSDVLLGDGDGCVFGFIDVPAVLEWGGVSRT